MPTLEQRWTVKNPVMSRAGSWPRAPMQLAIHGALMAALLAAAVSAHAGSCTADSIISQQDAIGNAQGSIPTDQQLNGVSCTTMVRDLSARYRCTVTWGPRQE